MPMQTLSFRSGENSEVCGRKFQIFFIDINGGHASHIGFQGNKKGFKKAFMFLIS
jgi:hypothetical protein